MTNKSEFPRLAAETAIRFAGMAAFPRLAYWARWPTRLGPRGLVTYAVVNWLALFGIRTWLVPYFQRVSEDRERAERALREQLGRDPTVDEILSHLGVTPRRP